MQELAHQHTLTQFILNMPRKRNRTASGERERKAATLAADRQQHVEARDAIRGTTIG